MNDSNPESLVRSLLKGNARVDEDGQLSVSGHPRGTCRSKIRRAYHWIIENAIHSPYVDIEYGRPLQIEGDDTQISLRPEAGYCSFILLPLLTLVTSRKMVLVGGPGRGKTSVATLMGLLSGASVDEMRAAVQHGHPQLTVADLLGSPLPSDLVKAQNMRDIKVAWRDWITMRVKIIDEYNRIPTKTQSALLSLMSEGYAQMYEQTIHSGTSAWFLTANDDLGGGTFQVIDALRDRIDLVVRCTPFHSQYLGALANRIAGNVAVEEFVPADLKLSGDDLSIADREIRAIHVPEEVLSMVGFFLGQLDFCRQASNELEFMNKDTLALSQRRVAHVCTEDCPLDKLENLCSQTENGVSPRAYQALIHYAKAIAWFRGVEEVSLEDFQQMAPWILFDKLRPNQQSEFFQKSEFAVLLTDRAAWIRQLFDSAIQQYAAFATVREPLEQFRSQVNEYALTVAEAKARMLSIQQTLQDLLASNEFNAPIYEEVVRLKHLYNQCQHQLANAGPEAPEPETPST